MSDINCVSFGARARRLRCMAAFGILVGAASVVAAAEKPTEGADGDSLSSLSSGTTPAYGLHEKIGMFLSVDPVTAYHSPIGQFHRYRYANNNPYGLIDPDGRYSCDPTICAAIKAYVGKLRESARNLRDRSDQRDVQRLVRYIGIEGSKGPHYVPGELKGNTAAQTDQKGTTTIDSGKMTDAATGAMTLGHEAQHDVDAQDRGGIAGTSSEVRETETNAYRIEATIGKGLGIGVSADEQARGVDDSVKNWEDRQKPATAPSKEAPR